MKIAMASDVVSPFCWMACTQVEQAILDFPDMEFQVEILPFQVSPGLPQGYTFNQYQREYMIPNFGSAAAVEDMLQQVTAMGKQHGCNFRLDKISTWPNSKKAHGLWALGNLSAQRWAIHASICQAHFELGLDLNNIDVLQQIGESHQLDPQLIRKRLENKTYIEDILADTMATRRQGITSVPTIVLEDEYLVTGVGGRDRLSAAIRQVLED